MIQTVGMGSTNGSSFHREDHKDRKVDSKVRPGAAFGPRRVKNRTGLFVVLEVFAGKFPIGQFYFLGLAGAGAGGGGGGSR